MKKLIIDITTFLEDGKSIALVGTTGSGKTWFVLNELIPELERAGKKIEYFKDLERAIVPKNDAEIVILDEFETLIDRNYLEKAHPEEKPYYTEEYVRQVKGWLDEASKIKKQLILIVTRDEGDVKNFVQNVRLTDWGMPILPIKYLDSRLEDN